MVELRITDFQPALQAPDSQIKRQGDAADAIPDDLPRTAVMRLAWQLAAGMALVQAACPIRWVQALCLSTKI